jgi:hypothetical protein
MTTQMPSWPDEREYTAEGYQRRLAEAAIARLRAIDEHCHYVRNVSPVARAVLRIIGPLPTLREG